MDWKPHRCYMCGHLWGCNAGCEAKDHECPECQGEAEDLAVPAFKRGSGSEVCGDA
jgi:hypothetical protein